MTARTHAACTRNAPAAVFSGCAKAHFDDSITPHNNSKMELPLKNGVKRREKQVARTEPKGGEGVGRSPETFATTHPHP